MKVEDILKQKINEIQSRLPIPLNIPSFSDTLNKTIIKNSTKKDIADDTMPEKDSVSISNSKSSFEAKYPMLSQKEIQNLMPRINAAIEKAAEKYGIDKNLIRAVIKAESSFQPLALSTSGAQGLMQLMPETAQWLNVSDPYNIEQNILGGTQYLKDQLNSFNGDLKLALAAYNAGPNAVRKHSGIPPYKQTQNYVLKVLEYYNMYKQF